MFPDIRHKNLFAWVFCVLLGALAIAAWPSAAGASPEQGGGHRGGGIGGGIIIDLTPLLTPREPPPRHERPHCGHPLVWSSRAGRCVCPTSRGYVSVRGRCVPRRPPAEVVIKKPPQPDVDVVRVQKCLDKANFDPGPIDGDLGRKTMNAFRDFQKANGLAGQPASLSDKESVDKLFEICDKPETPTRQASTPPSKDGCLPQDLYDMLTSTYGRRSDIKPCSNACLPKPASFAQSRIDSLAAQHGINWCGDCVRMAGWLPLADVLRIERLAGVTLCADPPALCFLPTPVETGTYEKVRTIFKKLPAGVRKEGDIAIIIGNETYKTLPENPNGRRDAAAVRTLLVEQLGFREENIIELRDASLSDFEGVFGGGQGGGMLAERLGSDKPGDVFIYVSSHGMAVAEENKGFLLPVDAAFDKSGTGAYALQQLYDNLAKLGARTIMLMLEVSFSQDVNQLVDPPNLPQLAASVLPETSVPGLAVFTAADRDQRTLEDPEFGIGLFTRYLIEGLAGQADEKPIGNSDKRIDTVELYVHTANMVRMAARKTQGLEQKPLLAKHDNLVVGRLGEASPR